MRGFKNVFCIPCINWCFVSMSLFGKQCTFIVHDSYDVSSLGILLGYLQSQRMKLVELEDKKDMMRACKSCSLNQMVVLERSYSVVWSPGSVVR